MLGKDHPMGERDVLSPERVHRILCVCTGNSCRSVMAQGLLRHYLKDRPEIQVISAGIGTEGGLGATPETIEVLQKEGIDVASHLGQPVTPDLVRKADLILAMDVYHYHTLARWYPEAKSKLYLLKEFQAPGPVGDPSVPDPIGRPLEVYEACLMMIKDAVQRVVAWLNQRR